MARTKVMPAKDVLTLEPFQVAIMPDDELPDHVDPEFLQMLLSQHFPSGMSGEDPTLVWGLLGEALSELPDHNGTTIEVIHDEVFRIDKLLTADLVA